MSKQKQKDNVVVFRKKSQLNIGLLLFGILFIYLIATVVIYLTTDRTTAYEVRMGSILKDTAFTGMAIREEEVVNAKQAGYIHYYSTENTKVKVGSKIYVTSMEPLDGEDTKQQETGKKHQLTQSQKHAISLSVQAFTESFSDDMFSDVYSFKDSIRNSISGVVSANKNIYLDQLRKDNQKIALSTAYDDGIVVYNADGYEQCKVEDVTPEFFQKSDYKDTSFYNNMKVSEGDPVYKLITAEKWSLVVPIDEGTANSIQDRTSIRVRMKKDDQVLIAGLKVKEIDGTYMAYLNFKSDMIRYASERFLDIELILEDQSGLKIPKSAVTEKAFYTIPFEYITTGGNSNQKGVLLKDKSNYKFTPIDIYYSTDAVAYLDIDVIPFGSTLLKPESNMTYTIEETCKLKGVYNINKGYAVFKHVNILSESDDYYIVEVGTDYGLANYDHIALNSEKVKENDVISQ